MGATSIKIMSCDPVPADTIPGNPHWGMYEKLAETIAWPETTLDCTGLAKGYFTFPTLTFREAVNAVGITEQCYIAEKKGYDAFLINCMTDLGLKESRSLVDIPVVAPMESALLLAVTLGRKFSIIVHGFEEIAAQVDQVEKYGFGDRLASCRCPSEFIGVNAFMMALEEPEKFTKIVAAEMSKAVKEDGTEVLWYRCTIGCTILTENGLFEVDGAQVLNPVAAAIKRAETLVCLKRTLGLGVCKNTIYAPPPPGWEKERPIAVD